ncbi:hypothetical protein TCA2_4571 [Paenibacillus sp. TCA20]|uniref:hypothetical protein n=1 Tax=Paenibacillus sp. TCA20 TaxID=1499968 RepID=UPI0004D5F091|nr:hypothetical protein [Paenibacillus sp. TCA20]GAK42079.1 hypothetical protein TCA2_4571 [Paenibacillus sp. TCA20]
MSEPIKNNSQLLYEQAKAQFDAAKAAFDDGSIKTNTKLIQTVFQAFESFFTSIGQPQMVLRLAPEGGPPWSEDYNNMMDEIKKDMEIMYQEIDLIGRALYTDFNHNMVQHSILQSQFGVIQDKLKDLQLLSSNMQSNGKITFHRNDFLNNDKIDYDRTTGTAASIENGIVTLPQTDSINLSQVAQVTIIPGNKTYDSFILGTESNGFPGNNHEVTVSGGNTQNDYTYQYVGGKNNHAAYGSVLDGNPDTWFEYELVNIRDHDKQNVAKNLGFAYQVHGNQRLNWARDPENGVLKLHMQIILNEATTVNAIDVEMYTPPNQGARTAIVKDILISDGSGMPESVIGSNKKDDDYVFHFAPRTAKVISVLFEQRTKYYTDIGHEYYEQNQQAGSDIDYAMNTATKQVKPGYLPRVEGPLMALQDIGVEVSVKDSSVNAYYPLQGEDASSPVLDDAITSLSRGITQQTIDIGTERFEGWRYTIGIRNINVYSYEYEQSGEIVTEPYFFEQPLEKITLSVDEDNPLMIENAQPGTEYKWIKYFISIDDGATWYPISPLEHQEYNSGGEEAPPKIYTVQQVEKSSQALTTKTGYIESEYPVYSLRLRMLFERPEDEE